MQIDRVCISINNRCNLSCKYCHFHEKKDVIKNDTMDVFEILDNIIKYIESKDIKLFKIGFVGNGEPLLEYNDLKEYILHISGYIKRGKIMAYSITNGLLLNEDMIRFFAKNNVNLGFSIDGTEKIHDMYRCNTHRKVLEKIELYKRITGNYPSMNCTVGKEVIKEEDATIKFFEKFDNRITFSRMIGKYGISLEEFNRFLDNAQKSLNVRRGGYDCTMYGGMCGAGINNFFFANGKVFLCGNCVDLEPVAKSDIKINELEKIHLDFDREKCYKEMICD